MSQSIEPPTTLRELADHLGLAVSTVSRTLSGQGDRYRIGKSTQARIEAAATEFGVRANPAARGLRLKRTLTLGLLLPDITNPFFAAIARAVERGAAEKGYLTILCDAGDDAETERQALRVLRERRVDALIACPAGDDPEPFAELAKSGTPLVFVDRFFEKLSAPSVTSDDFEAARNVGRTLAEAGHRQVGCLQGDPRTSSSRQRGAGFREGLREGGCEAAPVIAGHAFSISDGYAAAQSLLKNDPRPTALFCYGNVNALGALQALGEAGLRIPEDISLVTFDDQPWATVLATPLSAVVQDTRRLADEALKLVFSELETPGSQSGERVHIPTEYTDRGSISRLTP